MLKSKYFTLNFGPQHPAAHGVLRLIIYMAGEVVKRTDPHIGLLHRGTEKLIEFKTFLQSLPYFSRLDYVATMSQEHLFCVAVENLLDLELTSKSSFIRMLFLELTRIFNHLLAIATHALDVGAMTPFLWLFEDREKIMEFYERISGARMHTSYFRFGGVQNDLNEILLIDIHNYLLNFDSRIDELEELLFTSRIWRERLVGIGVVTKHKALSYCFSGPMLRGSGINWDLRKIFLYENYKNVIFQIPVGINGDCFDRFLIRMAEMRQSINLCLESISNIQDDSCFFNGEDVKHEDYKIQPPMKIKIKNSMENLIAHFKLYSEGFCIGEEELYSGVEAPKGEFGVYLETDGSNKPHRCKIKSPGFFHLQGIDFMSYNHLLADIVTIIGTQDIVFGEIDR